MLEEGESVAKSQSASEKTQEVLSSEINEKEV